MSINLKERITNIVLIIAVIIIASLFLWPSNKKSAIVKSPSINDGVYEAEEKFKRIEVEVRQLNDRIQDLEIKRAQSKIINCSNSEQVISAIDLSDLTRGATNETQRECLVRLIIRDIERMDAKIHSLKDRVKSLAEEK